ncbi:hypothetical protein CEXT_284341 [Caerostris extrusa]|uniref:Uncharacterized protein n=1 Tax=Caerostris extrusa TaxID=172846 RepID=A0AAV4Q486_CAEEX|nr:hypothetical protein CEXT_284341 [Caerostris extrusa]
MDWTAKSQSKPYRTYLRYSPIGNYNSPLISLRNSREELLLLSFPIIPVRKEGEGVGKISDILKEETFICDRNYSTLLYAAQTTSIIEEENHEIALKNWNQ